MYTVTINKENFKVEKEGEITHINEDPFKWDLIRVNAGNYHIIRNQVSYSVELLDINPSEKSVTLKLNNKVSKITIKDRFDLLLEKLGMNLASVTPLMDINAPMPGLIVDIKVKVGDTIKKGDSVLVLEAMKMENIIKSGRDGQVKTITVEIGTSVEKNQVLIQF